VDEYGARLVDELDFTLEVRCFLGRSTKQMVILMEKIWKNGKMMEHNDMMGT